MDKSYKKVFGGNAIKATRIELALKDSGITPVRKDETASARLAGFGSPSPELVEIFVHQDEETKALSSISKISWD